MQIGLSYDHNGYEIGQKVKEYLTNKGYKVIDYNNKYDKEDDYPKEALKMLGNIKTGILICGSGVGMSIIAKKVNPSSHSIQPTDLEIVQTSPNNQPTKKYNVIIEVIILL